MSFFEVADAISFWGVVLLACTSFFTSLLTASVGIGGGMLLLAAMAQVMPAPAIVPVHGAVQLGSNAGRAIIMRPHIDWPILLYFLIGSSVGALVGGHIVVALPVAHIQLILALFILYSTWAPKLSLVSSSKKTVLVGGLFSTILTMFVGATGPFVAATLKRLGLDKLTQVATMASCMVAQHGVKLVVFALLGFSFAPYLPFILLLVATGFLGTLVGRQFLEKLSEEVFSKLLKAVLTLLALRLLWKASSMILGAQ